MCFRIPGHRWRESASGNVYFWRLDLQKKYTCWRQVFGMRILFLRASELNNLLYLRGKDSSDTAISNGHNRWHQCHVFKPHIGVQVLSTHVGIAENVIHRNALHKYDVPCMCMYICHHSLTRSISCAGHPGWIFRFSSNLSFTCRWFKSCNWMFCMCTAACGWRCWFLFRYECWGEACMHVQFLIHTLLDINIYVRISPILLWYRATIVLK